MKIIVIGGMNDVIKTQAIRQFEGESRSESSEESSNENANPAAGVRFNCN